MKYDPKVTVPVTSHLSNVKTDPIRNFKFVVNINHSVKLPQNKKVVPIRFSLGFMNVSGFSATVAPIPYRSGQMNTTPQMVPGQTSFTPISMSRGMFLGSSQTLAWFTELFSVQVGGGNYVDNGGRAFRADVDVYVLPHPRTDKTTFAPTARYKVYNAWPTTISMGDLNAGDNSFLVENLVLTHEGWEFLPY